MMLRIVTGLILGSVIFAAIWLLPPDGFALAAAVLLAFALWEWFRLTGMSGYWAGSIFLLLNGIVFAVIAQYPDFAMGMLWAGVFWWVIQSVRVLTGSAWRQAGSRELLVHGFVVFAASFSALVSLRNLGDDGRLAVVTLLLLVIAADTGAYFTGRRFGKTPLAPSISPKKTVEGLLGGVACVVLVALCMGIVAIGVTGQRLVFWVACCAITGLFSVMGDLSESALKRKAGVKDSGTLLPGHGGALDRIDSVLAASPVFVVGLIWLQ